MGQRGVHIWAPAVHFIRNEQKKFLSNIQEIRKNKIKKIAYRTKKNN